jgi:WXG100 family type VII secretion target
MADNTGQFTINPAEIQKVAPQFSSASSELQAALTTLEHTLAALGAPWGDDKQGAAFGAAYSPQQKAITTSLGVLVKGLASIDEGLSAHAANHADTDAHTAATMR